MRATILAALLAAFVFQSCASSPKPTTVKSGIKCVGFPMYHLARCSVSTSRPDLNVVWVAYADGHETFSDYGPASQIPLTESGWNVITATVTGLDEIITELCIEARRIGSLIEVRDCEHQL